MVTSFSSFQLKLIRAASPRIGRAQLVSIGKVEQSYLSINEYLADIMDFVGPSAGVYGPFYLGATADAVATARHRGISFWPWTMNAQAGFETRRMNGAAGLTAIMRPADETPSSPPTSGETSAGEPKPAGKLSLWPWIAAAVVLGAAVWYRMADCPTEKWQNKAL